MAIWDWPTASCFTPREVQVGVRTPKAGWQAAFSGDRTRLSHLGDRLRMTLRLPGCTPAEGAVREAFVTEIVSAGHQVRLGRLDRPTPQGSLRGAPTVAVAAAAGARSVQVTGATAAPNLLRSPQSFNLAPWVNAWGGSAVITPNSGVDPGGTVQADFLQSASGASAVAQAAAVAVGTVYTFSVWAQAATGGTPATNIGLQVRDGAGGAAAVLQSATLALAVPGVWYRGSVQWTSDRTGTVHVGPVLPSPGTSGVFLWGAQFEVGPVASPFAGLPNLQAGDTLGALGGLLPVGYLGAQLDDTGAGTVPLAVPLRRALPAGTALTWDRPAAVWDLQLDAVDLSYHRARWQRELELPFQEVP